MTTDTWKIQRDRTKCRKVGCPLPTAKEYYAVLELDDECVRRDLCATCFQKLERPDGKTPIFWLARRRTAEHKGPTLDIASLRVLFDRLGEEDGDRARELRYFVALLLLRKRALRMVDAQNDEQERADLVVVDPKVDGMRPVALFAPEVDENRLAGLRDELFAAMGETDAASDRG